MILELLNLIENVWTVHLNGKPNCLFIVLNYEYEMFFILCYYYFPM
jgi:hypothetical protein